MEEKQSIRISLSTFCLIIALIVIAVMGYFIYEFYNDKQVAINKAEELNSQVSNLENTVENLKGKLEAVSNVISENNNSSNQTSSQKTENVTSNPTADKTYKSIILNGTYAIKNSDIGYEFSSNGNVKCSTNITESEGTYTTIGENEIELTFVKETIWDDETNKSTTRTINRQEKFKYIDENTLMSEFVYNGETITNKFVKCSN